MKHTKKILALALSIAVVASIAAAGTLAYLTSTTGEVVNTFTVGNIQIDLDEHYYDNETGELTDNWVVEDLKINGNDYERIMPGQTLPKDPTVTVKANSEECYLYVMIQNGLNNAVEGAVTLDINDTWELISGDETVGIYRLKNVVPSTDADAPFVVFDHVLVNPDLDNEDMLAIDDGEGFGQAIVVKAFAHQATTRPGDASTAIDLDVVDAAAVEALTGYSALD